MSFIEDLHDVVDPWITCHAYQGWALWIGGRPAAARQMNDRALALSQELQHPFTRALALSFDSWLCQWRGDVDAHRRSARSLSLRVAVTLAEFWLERGRGGEASALLDVELAQLNGVEAGEDAGVRQARALLASAA